MVQLPFESVTVVDFPSDALLVDMLPLPPECMVVVPAGPVVLPLTVPPPAVMEVERLVEGGFSPDLSSTILQLPDELVADPPLLELLELLVCAIAMVAPNPMAANAKMNCFMSSSRKRDGMAARRKPRSRLQCYFLLSSFLS
jgi:hypothetical protein